MLLIRPSRRRTASRWLMRTALAWVNIAQPVWAANVAVEAGAPQGFEQLEAPRQTVITVSYGGDVLGSFPAHFAPGQVQFDMPADIVAKIPTIKNPIKVTAAMQAALPAHADLLCSDKHKDHCGLLKPDIAGIIFNENQLSAELFINPDELSLVDKNPDRYLPLPEQHFSSVYGFSGAVAGAANQTTNYTLTNTATFAAGEARLATQSTASNTGLRVDTFAGDVERRGWDSTAGLFRSQSMQLLSDRDMAGVSVATSSRTYLDDHKTEGNDIILSLPRHSLVSIYREGRLYSSNAYDAGNQRIDTSDLPDGAYPIVLKIQDADGSVREETRFFAKTQEIPPPDKPVYYAQMGVIRRQASVDTSTIPALTGHPIARLGTVRRIDDNLGLNVSLLGTSDRAISETGIFWVGNGKKFGTTAMASTRGDYGLQANYLHYLDQFSASIDARKTWMSAVPIPGFEDLSHSFTQVSANLSYAVATNINVGVRGNYSQSQGAPTNTSYGPHAEWRIWQKNENSFSMTADATRGNGRTDGSLLFNFTYRLGEYGMTSSGGLGLVSSKGTPLGNARVFHDDPTPGNALLLGAGIVADSQQRTANADADWKNHFGEVRGNIQDGFGKLSTGISYGGNFNFNAAQLSDEIHLGGSQNENSAVIIETDGDSATEMKIFVNGNERSTVQVGSHQVLYLSPFNTYRIHLSPITPGLFDYQAGDRKVTLYPGNVTKLTWHINSFYVVAARIVNAAGLPLSNAMLNESHTQVATDEDGRLQAELSAPKTLTFASADSSTCQVQLPPAIKPVNGVLLYPDALQCLPPNQVAQQIIPNQIVQQIDASQIASR